MAVIKKFVVWKLNLLYIWYNQLIVMVTMETLSFGGIGHPHENIPFIFSIAEDGDEFELSTSLHHIEDCDNTHVISPEEISVNQKESALPSSPFNSVNYRQEWRSTDHFPDFIPELEDRYDEVSTIAQERELIKAAADSLCDGNCLPLIKHELKMKIQLKRMERGEEELVIDSGVNKDEKILMYVRKREKAREQNRLASLRSREKKSMQERKLLEKVKRLSDANDDLVKEITALKEEVMDLKGKLENCRLRRCPYLSLTRTYHL